MSVSRTFIWATRREANDGYVLERVAGTSYVKEFGPMPPHVVPAFVESRRRLIALRMKNFGASYITPEFLDTLH